MMKNDTVLATLTRLVTQDRSLCTDLLRLEGFLRDYAGQHRREINVLVTAAREGVPAELLKVSGSEVPSLVVDRLVRRLHDNAGIDQALARWAVEGWAAALGKTVASGTPISPAAPPLQPPPVAPPPQPQSRPVSPVASSPQPQPSSPAAPPPQPRPQSLPGQYTPSITIAILGVGMSWLSSIFFPSPEKEIKMYLILTMFLLSFSGSMSYILTRSPVVALVTQILYVMYQTFFVDEYILLFGIIQSIIFFMVFSWFKHRDVLFGVIIGNICIGMGVVFLAFAAQSFRIPGVEVALEWLAVSSCYAFGALIAIVLGKMFGKC